MSDEKKEEFLKTIPPELRYRMAEGNPHNTSDTELDGEIILKISKEISDKYEINTEPSDNSPEPEKI